jgi:hypothetical protein
MYIIGVAKHHYRVCEWCTIRREVVYSTVVDDSNAHDALAPALDQLLIMHVYMYHSLQLILECCDKRLRRIY